MKFINKSFLIALAAMVPVAACDTDELHERNINPQASSTISMEFLFTGAQLGTASGGSAGDNRYIDWRTNIGFCGYAIQQLATAGTQGGIYPGERYTDNVESYNAPWEFIYGDQLKNLAEVLRQTSEDGFDAGKTNLRQAARILKAFNFHRLTDYYGNIPYTNALQGIQGVFIPEYDTQEAIYTDMLKELDEAAAALKAFSTADPNDVNFADADLFYEGDITKWKKFAYSLMLRLAMRVSVVNPALANQYVQKAVTGGVFTSNADNVWLAMSIGPSEWTNQNGISRAFASGDGGQPTTLSKTFIDELQGAAGTGDDDPRLTILSQGVAGNPANQLGLPNGLDQRTLNEYMGVPDDPGVNVGTTFSQMNVKLLQDDDPYMLMNYAEVALLLAEASERGIGGLSSGTTQSYYEAGVKAAMQMYTPFDATDNSLEVTDAKVTAYLAARPFPGGSTARLERIGTQLWLSQFMNWWEAWSNWRRTGYPVLAPVDYQGNVTGGTIPVKLRYPNQEIATNPANYEAGATLPDEPTTRVWWDVD